MLSYAVVVATRNRLESLGASLPTFAGQSLPAGKIVVVDRSDDHGAVRDYCTSFAAQSPVPLEIVQGTVANSAAQRNQGLVHVTEDVTIFPDDDVLWYPNTAQKIIDVYADDTNRRYGAVSASDVYQPPGADAADVPEKRNRLTENPVVMRIRNKLEAAAVPQPFEVYGVERTDQLRPLALADGLAHPLVPTIGGYRMSFRTDLAKALGFDDVLGSRIGYAIHEDKDLALRVLREGYLIAGADEARVFHNSHPSKRADGFKYGFFHILNYLFVCCKVFEPESRARVITKRYLRYKVALYSLRLHDRYSREVFRGARAALSGYSMMADSSVDELANQYAKLSTRNGL